ncbi:MAG: drug/metabolite exporter YedA [Deltaproteobacteria bacterium]|nr:drug/metabolite exporter YedA [Deltaproteobacteria bacterium]
MRLFLALAAVYVIWSSTYLAIRIAVVELPPFLQSSLRFVVAGIVLMVIALRRGVAFPRARTWLHTLPIGVLLCVGGNGFVSMAETSVSSGGAAVVCATMPLWVGVLGAFTGVRPTRREWLSLALGFAGVVVLMGGPALAGEPLHVALLVASPICWAAGSLLSRRMHAAQNTFMFPAMQMITGGVALAAIAAAHGERLPLDASAQAWLALAYLCVAGSLLGFTAYNWLLRNARPVVATSYAYVNPILAVLLGAALSGEPLGASTVIANAMIVGAVMLALRKPAS